MKKQMDEYRNLKDELDEQKRLLEERNESENEQLINAINEAKAEKEKRMDFERRLRVVANQQQLQAGR